MRRLGVHTSIAGGLHLSLKRAHELGCNTLQIFSHNPRSWALRELSEEDISLFKSLRLRLDISPVYIHASYLVNMASVNKTLRSRSIDLLVSEMERADAIGADYVILHSGSASGEDGGIARKRAIDAMNEVAKRGNWKSGLVIENTAGEKGDISSTIKDMEEIINGVAEHFIAGICIDTCHAFAAGYDIRNKEVLKVTSNEIKECIGLNRVKLIHLNDSKGDMGSGIDRHEHIGLGRIGIKGLEQFINCGHFNAIPVILETPKKQETDDPMNLERVRKMIKLK
ncbi:MAG: deoxyribonuclease IV [Nitrospirae bacterium]|jgi:deoxyribonuclease IV|nr:deoxyribonuclease IV [Nitrospirota bacterium]